MSTRNKLQKFAEVLSFSQVVQSFDPSIDVLIGKDHQEVKRKGVWCPEQYGNDNPLVLELACGRGEYAIGLAQLYPDKNFLGVDVKGARIWRGAKNAIELSLGNVAFLRCRIEGISKYFGEAEVDEIWITFPDPFLKDKKSNRRLSSPHFLDQYRKILKPGGIIHLKTDEPVLYEYTLEILAEQSDVELIFHSPDLYAEKELHPEWQIKTYYEQLHIADGQQICLVEWRFT